VETDGAVQRLRESLAAAARGGKKNADGTVTVIDVKEDPELAKKQAELAEREKLRAARRRQQLADREIDRGRRVGMHYRTSGAGLTVGGLEDDDGMLTTRARPRKPRGPNRRGEIYTDEEEEYDRRGRTREDEYDENDGFLVGSDEELEVVEDDEEEEEELEDEDLDAEGESDEEVRIEKPPRKEKQESPKRKSVQPENEGGGGSPPTRKKPRYVVESDEDE
jgi:RNA polymerase-associated protein LEO1